MKKLFLSLLIIPCILLTGCINDNGNDSAGTADVIIYGGTSAAITTAVQVIKMGKSVIIIAFGSIRMEPVFMILGQSAGTMAAMAIEKKTGIHDLSYDEIRQRLIEDGQVLEYAE